MLQGKTPGDWCGSIGPLLDRSLAYKLTTRSGQVREGISWAALYHSDIQWLLLKEWNKRESPKSTFALALLEVKLNISTQHGMHHYWTTVEMSVNKQRLLPLVVRPWCPFCASSLAWCPAPMLLTKLLHKQEWGNAQDKARFEAVG